MKRIAAVIGFSFGITLFALNFIGYELSKYVGIFLLFVFVTALAVPKYRQAAVVPLCAGTSLLACILFLFSYNGIVEPQLFLDTKSADAVFCITNLGEKTTNGYAYTAKVVSINMAGAPQGIKVRLYTPEKLSAEGYQLISGKLRFFAVADNGFASFGEWGKQIFLHASVKKYTVSDEFVSSPMRKILEIRQHIAASFMSNVGGDEGALGLGMIIGDRSYISDELMDAFKTTGTSHLTAVSGLHLSAVTGVFVLLFNRFGISKKVSSPILICIIVFYCMLSDFSKSVVRASVMLTIMMICNMTDDKADSLNSLGIAILVICLNPFAVCDVATLLTVVCVLAIVVVYPHIQQRVYVYQLYLNCIQQGRKPLIPRRAAETLAKIVDMFLLSAVLSVCTIPIMCLFFGYFSLIGILLNVIIFPLGSLAVTVSMLCSAFSGVWLLGDVLAWAERLLNGLIISLIRGAARLPYAAVNLVPSATVFVGMILVVIAMCVIFIPRITKKAAIMSLALFSAFLVGFQLYDNGCSHIYITQSGAAVICKSGKAEVCGLTKKNDINVINDYIKSRRCELECVYCSDSKLAKALGCSANNNKNYTVDVDGVTFAYGGSGDITLDEASLSDRNGTVMLSVGDVEYTVKNGSFSVAYESPVLLT
ncbi:MAG: ComEC/Rec2 family competence protein [Eubacterium sp.]|nr:ComEC/Rec2 family competence protein [Eubacterium sp.]